MLESETKLAPAAPNPEHPTKAEIAGYIDKLAVYMADLAVVMDYYGGFAEWATHSRQLMAASRTTKEWAVEIRKEVRQEAKLKKVKS
jgi:hypothetical protein